MARCRPVLVAVYLVLAGSVAALPWYALDVYVATGWEGTAWARAVLVLALGSAGLALAGAPSRVLTPCALGILAIVSCRVIVPPDFGFGFAGLAVPVERRAGCWVALAAATLAVPLAHGARD
jgi:hypothetical protein